MRKSEDGSYVDEENLFLWLKNVSEFMLKKEVTENCSYSMNINLN